MELRRAPRGCVATASVSILCRGPAVASSVVGSGHQSRAHTGPPANSTLSTAKVASVAPAAACWLSVPSAASCAEGSDTGQLHSSTPRELNSDMCWLSADRGSLMDTDSGWEQQWQHSICADNTVVRTQGSPRISMARFSDGLHSAACPLGPPARAAHPLLLMSSLWVSVACCCYNDQP
jgi:hypothetical protein